MPDYAPIVDGFAFSCTAGADITAGQLLEVTGSLTVGPAGAGSTKVLGVAARNAAVGESVAVCCDGIQMLVPAAGGVTAGDVLAAGPAGTVAPIGAGSFATKIGVALTTGPGPFGQSVRVRLSL